MAIPCPDIFSRLPAEIITNIFSYLPCSDLAHCLSTCREWYYIANDPLLWRDLDLSNLHITSLSNYKVPQTLHRHLISCRYLKINSPVGISVLHVIVLLQFAAQSLNLQSLSLVSVPNFRSNIKALEHFFLSSKSRGLVHVDLSRTCISTPVIQALIQTNRSSLCSLKLEFSNAEDPALRVIAQAENLEYLSLLGCFSFSKCGLRLFLSKRLPTMLKTLNIRLLPDVRIGWLYKLLLKPNSSIETIDVSGCERLTLGDLRSLQKLKPSLKMLHTAKLEEENIWGYRKYIEHLSTLQPALSQAPTQHLYCSGKASETVQGPAGYV